MNPTEDSWAVRQEVARRLGEKYPGWSVWITERMWWATSRTPALPAAAVRRGLYMTVTADTAEELKDALDEQVERWERFTRPRPWTR